MDKLATLYSMTGYAVVTKELSYGSLNLELRSVNNRYLDIQFRLPDELRSLEAAMREFLTSRLNRGKVECRINFSRVGATEDLLLINPDLFQRLLEMDRTIGQRYPMHGAWRWRIFFAGREYWEQIPFRGESMRALHRLARYALDEFAAARAREGEKLRAILLERLGKMRRLVAEVAPRIPHCLPRFRKSSGRD